MVAVVSICGVSKGVVTVLVDADRSCLHKWFKCQDLVERPNEVKDLIIQRTDPCGIACAVRS